MKNFIDLICAGSKAEIPEVEGGHITSILTPHYPHCSEVPPMKSVLPGLP